MITITCYGGVGVIGGNKVLLEDGDSRLFFDFGTDFDARGRYFEEFLAPRATVGLLDPLEMGLLPPLEGLYRPDLAPPDDIWSRFRDRPGHRRLSPVDGVLLSHAHLDHSGSVSFLHPSIPVYATAMSAFIAKAVQDCAGGGPEGEVVYWNERQPGDDGLLGATASMPYQRRPFVLAGTGPLSPEAKQFWSESPREKKVLLEAPLHVGLNRVGSLPVRHFPVDHSVYGACAWAVETSAGWVVYTGDLRVGVGARAADSERFIEEARALRPRALVCEGTQLPLDEESPRGQVTEAQVREKALQQVKAAGSGLVVADFGPRNIERLLTFLEVSRATGRRLVVTTKDAYLVDAMRLVSSEVPDLASEDAVAIYRDAKAHGGAWEERLRQRHAPKLVGAKDVGASPGDFVLCFSFWDLKNLVDIRPCGGRYIYSASEAFSEEQMTDIDRLRNWLDHFGLSGVGLPLRERRGDRLTYRAEEPGLHASGHASSADLLRLVHDVAPRTVIPVHTENPRYFVEALRGSGIEVLIPQYGVPIVLS